MYIPAPFQMPDTKAMIQFIRQNSFGILFSHVQGQPMATHLPLLFAAHEGENGRLLGHFARLNPHWTGLEGEEVLVVFPGPHAYISPSWYVEPQAVPTWNYVSVHVYGRCRIVQDEQQVISILREMVQYYEPHSDLPKHLDEAFYVQMAQAVVGFELGITAIEGKIKLSQNKSPETVRGVIKGLQTSGDCLAGEVAKLMQEQLQDIGKESHA